MAPFLTQLLGAGLRLVANAALVKGKDYIKDKTGVDLDRATLSEEDRLKLRQYEIEHEEELLRLQLEDNKLALEETKVYLQDIADARANQTAIQTSASAPWYAKAIQPGLAAFTVLLTFFLFYYFVSVADQVRPLLLPDGKPVVGADGKPMFDSVINQTQKDLIIYILGVLSAIVTQIFSYYFGSSRGSSNKTDTLDRVLDRTVDGPRSRREAP